MQNRGLPYEADRAAPGFAVKIVQSSKNGVNLTENQIKHRIS